MKFLTLDCYNSWYGDYADSSRLYAAYEQYRRHLEALEGILPVEVLFFHEVDVIEDGRMEHRLLFHYGVWFAIRCRALHCEKASRSNRDLPRLKDRFPDGPSTTPVEA